MESIETQLASGQAAPESARAFVREILKAWELHRISQVTELLISELVTNAVRHVDSTITVRASRRTSRVRVEVEDASPTPPRLQHPQPDEPDGRGILIIDTLADDWGTDVDSDGKTVWFEIDLATATVKTQEDL